MQLNKTLRYLIISGLFILPFLSLIVITSLYFPYITGKNFLFRTIIEIVFVCFVALSLRDLSLRPRLKNPITLALLTFIIILFIADLFGEHFYKSFWSNFERMEGFITFLHLLAFFFIASVIFNTEKLWRRWFYTAFAVSIWMGFIALYQHFHDLVERPEAKLGNSTYLGALMLFNVFFLLFYLMRVIRQKGIAWKWKATGYAAAILFDFYILFLSGTRGAFLGLVAGFIFIAIVFAFFEKEQKAVKFAGIILLVLLVLGLGFVTFFRNSAVVKDNFFLARFSAPISAVLTFDINGFVEKEGRGRLLIWQAALNGFKERPILGWGQENFNYIFNKYYVPAMYTEEQWFDRSHNVILDWLTQAGILGLLAYLSLFGFLIHGIWRKGQSNFSLEDKTVLTGLLIAYFIHNFFVFDNITSYIFFFALLGYVNRNQPSNLPVKHWQIHPDISNYALSPIAFILAATIFYFGVWTPHLAGAALIKGLTYQQSYLQAGPTATADALLSASENFQKALAYNTYGSSETREQLLNFLPIALQSGLDDKNKGEMLALTQSEMQKQLKSTPTDARYFLFYGFSLDRIGYYKDATPYLEKARTLSPTKQTILFEIGLNYISQKEYDKGLEVLKEAYDEAPAFKDAQVYYLIGLIYTAKNQEADNLIATIDLSSIPNENLLLKAYFDTKQFGKIAAIYHSKMVANPGDIQSHLGAAAFDLAINDRQGAIVDLETAITFLSPPNDQNAVSTIAALRDYINQIKAGKNPLPLNQ